MHGENLNLFYINFHTILDDLDLSSWLLVFLFFNFFFFLRLAVNTTLIITDNMFIFVLGQNCQCFNKMKHYLNDFLLFPFF